MPSSDVCFQSSRKLSCISEDSPSMSDCLIICGTSHLAEGNIPQAVSDFSDACEILSLEFGETAEECGEAYFYYGKALLELGKIEGDVLDNAMEGFDINGEEKECSEQIEDPEVLTTNEKMEVIEEVAEALEDHYELLDDLVNLHLGVADSEEDEEDSDSTEDDSDIEVEAIEDKKGEVLNEEEHEDADDVGNLEAAWEMLELAKITLGKTAATKTGQAKIDADTKICMAILCLGEVSLERMDYGLAAEDFRLCLERSKTVMPEDSRFLAEVHYQLGMTLGHLGRFPEAEACLKSSISVLRARAGNLGAKEGSEKEVVELGEIIADIEATIEEHKVEATTAAIANKTGHGKAVVEGVEGNLSKLVKNGGSSTGPATA